MYLIQYSTKTGGASFLIESLDELEILFKNGVKELFIQKIEVREHITETSKNLIGPDD